MHQIDAAPSATYRMNFTVGEHSARHLRRIVRSYLHLWRLEELGDAVGLAVTELLANVVRHVPDRRCALLVLRQASGVRIEVTDGAPGLPRASASGGDPDGLAEGGRGLLLVEAVADRWGVVPLARGGKTVWFECESKEPDGDRARSVGVSSSISPCAGNSCPSGD
ncbi:ATP-binding protein [Streptomyces sp. NPDC005279]|uniref:ATP-binding protein n=1 Tax=Streptomyces sp. NPDC005279 TaxID=3364712 RepID=UPI0036B608F2